MRHHPLRTPVFIAAALAALVLSGCSSVAGSEPGRTSAEQRTAGKRTPPRTSPSPSDVPSAAADDASPSAASSAPADPGGGRTTATDRLLTATELPDVHGVDTWEVTGTRRSEGESPFGTCHKYAMTSIGALRVVVREFRSPGATSPTTAGHLVADFPDETTARRALEVLESWRGQCGEELSEHERHDVGALRPVSAPGADAGWYLLTYGPVTGENGDVDHLDAQGIARVGRHITVLRLRTVGQDYDYPPGQEPMAVALRSAASKLA